MWVWFISFFVTPPYASPAQTGLGYTDSDRDLLARYGADALNFCITTPPEYR